MRYQFNFWNDPCFAGEMGQVNICTQTGYTDIHNKLSMSTNNILASLNDFSIRTI